MRMRVLGFVFGACTLMQATAAQTISELEILTADDAASGDLLGGTAAISGNTIVVGVPESGVMRGAAYVFVRTGTSWSQQAKLTASDPNNGDAFGVDVDIDGEDILVGAHLNDLAGFGPNVGSAYVFTRNGTSWTQQERLVPADGAGGDQFGFSVAIDAGTAVIGAVRDDAGSSQTGSARVFVRGGTQWTEQATLIASDGAENDFFGTAVDLEGDLAVVGAARHDAIANNEGKVYVYTRTGTTWTETAILSPPSLVADARFGSSVALSGSRLAVGAPRDDAGAPVAGAVHVYELEAGVWNADEVVSSPSPIFEGLFGESVALTTNSLFVGAPGESGIGQGDGVVYRLDPLGDAWTLRLTMVASQGQPMGSLGASVAADSVYVVAGAPGRSEVAANSGAAFVYDTACIETIDAPTTSFTTCVPLGLTDWEQTVGIPRFDPILGSLNGVDVEMVLHWEGELGFENLAPSDGSASFTIDIASSVSRPDSTELVGIQSSVQDLQNFGPYDGVTDFGGSSGYSSPLVQDLTASHSSPDPVSDLLLFTGPIGSPGLLNLDVETAVNVTKSLSGNVIWTGLASSASVSLTVTYQFDPSGVPYCFGDGECTQCPCANNAPAGSPGGCLNANGTSAVLSAAGTPSLLNDSLSFDLRDATPNTFGVLVSADIQLPVPMSACPVGSGVESPNLKGLRCLGVNLFRHGTRATGPDGAIVQSWGPPGGPTGGLIAQAGFAAGQQRQFQVFYRELPTIDCPRDQNTSNGVTVTFVP